MKNYVVFMGFFEKEHCFYFLKSDKFTFSLTLSKMYFGAPKPFPQRTLIFLKVNYNYC